MHSPKREGLVFFNMNQRWQKRISSSPLLLSLSPFFYNLFSLSTVAFQHAYCAWSHSCNEEQKQGERRERGWAGESISPCWNWSGCSATPGRLSSPWTAGAWISWWGEQRTDLKPEGQLEEHEQREKWRLAASSTISKKESQSQWNGCSQKGGVQD